MYIKNQFCKKQNVDQEPSPLFLKNKKQLKFRCNFWEKKLKEKKNSACTGSNVVPPFFPFSISFFYV